MSAVVDHRADSGDDSAEVDDTGAGGPPPDADPAVVEELADDPDEAGPEVVQDAPVPSPARLRLDFGAHLEANYQRLVAQLYAITLDPGEAHDVVQDAYSRAWRDWAVIGGSPDPSAWIRRVAVRSTVRSWRRVLARFSRSRPAGGGDPRTGALLAALGRLPAPERRAVVLFHMAGSSLGEIAAVEQVSPGTVQARLARARHVVTEGMADVLPAVLGLEISGYGDHDGYDHDGYDHDGATFAPSGGLPLDDDSYIGTSHHGPGHDEGTFR